MSWRAEDGVGNPGVQQNLASPIIKTSRLMLRVLELEDARALARLFEGDWEAIKQTGRMPYPATESALREWIGLHLAPGSLGFAVMRKSDGEVLGTAGLGGLDARVELGYTLGRAYWGQGLATEAVEALIAFAQELRLDALEAYSFPDNPASARVLEKTGFQELGIVRRDYPLRGGLRRVRHFRKVLAGGE